MTEPKNTPKDSLGDRMKSSYEDRYRFMLPRRTFTVLRVDGKAFHSYTRDCDKPYDERIVRCMDAALLALCEEIQGAAIGYVQSDEMSIVVGDFATINTGAWFDGNLQKIVSVAASIATRAFNVQAVNEVLRPLAMFDCRAFVIPDPVEVVNYLLWRQQDATRNSIQGLGRVYFSHKALMNVSCAEIQEKLFTEFAVNWNDCPTEEKRGRCAVRVEGTRWQMDREIPVFTADRDYIKSKLPVRQD